METLQEFVLTITTTDLSVWNNTLARYPNNAIYAGAGEWSIRVPGITMMTTYRYLGSLDES